MTKLSDLPFVTPADIAEKAAEVWHGGQVYRDWLGNGELTPRDMKNIAYWGEQLAAGKVVFGPGNTMHDYRHVTRLPEAAFDWPIYRAAILAGGSR